MSHIKQVFPKCHGMPEDWFYVSICSSLVERTTGDAIDQGEPLDWLESNNVNPLDVFFSLGEKDCWGKPLSYNIWFEPHQRDVGMLFKLAWGGA